MKRIMVIAVPLALALMALLAWLFPRTEAGEYVGGVVAASLAMAAAGDFAWRRWKGRKRDEREENER